MAVTLPWSFCRKTNVEMTLLEHLDSVAKRPAMYVGLVSFVSVRAYLHGLSARLGFTGIKYTREDYLAAAESRGWDPRGNIGIERDFIRRGLSDDQMVQELIAVEAQAYSKVLARVDARRDPSGSESDGQ